MRRRSLLKLSTAAPAVLLAGCSRPGGGRGPTTTTADPVQLTTTGGAAIEVRLAQIVIRDDDDGPHVAYRLHNSGTEAATLALRTLLHVEAGGTYEATAYADVQAGGEIYVEYRVVRYADLTEAEATAVRRGNADFELFINGDRSPDV